jgi:D-serine deaminase-like pyridoxal phosphate-dependent protein
MVQQAWYNINNINTLDTPALVVYPDRVKTNISLLVSMIDDVARLRPHVKTYKNKEVTLLLLAAGISKFKCATIAEAELLAISKVPDVLLAYQPVGPKLLRFIKLIHTYPVTKFSCLVDSVVAAKEISDAAKVDKLTIDVYLDLNVGMNRTGIKPGLDALQLYMYCEALPGLNPAGLHAYDGHIHDLDINKRTERCEASFKPVLELQQGLKQKGYPEPVIVAGGSPTFPIHSKRENVECSPGTFVYWDKGYQLGMPEQGFLPAALIVTRVVSLPDATKLCLDVGHKSISAENELGKRIYFLNAPELIPTGQSEEHLVVEAGKDHTYHIGDVLYGIPHHVCPTVALYERAYIIENNLLNGEWMNAARDRKINI